MPELNIAPNTNSMLGPAGSALSPSSATSGTFPGEGQGDPAAATFADILQRQGGNSMDLSVAATSRANIVLSCDTGNTAGAPEDALSILTIMMGMIGGKVQTDGGMIPSATAVNTADTAEDADSATPAAEILSAPMSGLIPVIPQTPPPPTKKADEAAVDELPSVTHSTANFAAANALPSRSLDPLAKSVGESGSMPEDFRALLAASHDESAITAQPLGTEQPLGTAQQQHGNAPISSSRAATNVATVNIPVGAQGWDREIGDKISWMSNRKETRAELVLNPPQLGRIEVTLTVSGDQTNAIFSSPNLTVRDALEASLPRLREILQDAGITLGQTQVGAESFQQSAGKQENGDNHHQGGVQRNTDLTSGELVLGGHSSPPWLQRGNGLVDTFA